MAPPLLQVRNLTTRFNKRARATSPPSTRCHSMLQEGETAGIVGK